jgi:hypothetical protein
MAESTASKSKLIDELLGWLRSLAEKGLVLDEYEFFKEAAGTNRELKKRVSAALESNGAPPLAKLTRDQYYQLTAAQFNAAVEQLLDELGLNLDQAKKLFCERLDWCSRRRGWKRFTGRLLLKVPPKWRRVVEVAGAAAPWIWEAISILMNIPMPIMATLLAVRLSAYFASGALDKLCECDKRPSAAV